MNRVLGVFAKEPRPGEVKTRLAAAFGAEPAAQLYEAFLRDLLPRLESLPTKLVLAYTPASGRNYFEQWGDGRFTIEEQTGANLGVRMAYFFQQQFERGADRVVLVGSDSPDLPTSRIEQAFAELDRCDLVFGPSTDGGYYLVGMSRFVPGVFEGIDWSTTRVFEQSMRQVDQLGLRRFLLEYWYDVDDAEDVRHLTEQIEAAHRSGRDPGVPHTEVVLRSASFEGIAKSHAEAGGRKAEERGPSA